MLLPGRISIGTKLSLAFAAMAAVSVLVVLVVLLAAGIIARDIRLAEAERLPAVLAAEQAQASLLRMLLHVRGYLVAGDERDIEHYAEERRHFDQHLARLQALSTGWTNDDALEVSQLAQEYASWEQWPQRLFELHNNPIANRPALRLARFEVQPRKVDVLRHIERLVALLREQGNAPRAALADVTAFQSSFDAMVTNLMAYAASGEINFKSSYGALLLVNAGQWQALTTNAAALGAPARRLIEAIDLRRGEIHGFAQQIIERMSGDRPYEDLYLYRTQLEPQGQRMLVRLQALTKRQRTGLQADLGRAHAQLSAAATPAMLAGGVAIGLAVALVWFAHRRIVVPVRKLGAVAEQVAAGDTQAIPGLESKDEIERLARTLHTRLRKDEQERLLESISDALWSADLDADGEVTYRYFTAGIRRITGRSPGYFLDAPVQRWTDSVHEPDRAARVAGFVRLASGNSDREDAEYRIVHADGGIHWVRDNIRSTRLADGRVVLHGVLSDITERKAAESALRESEGRFRSLTELSSDWFWRQDETFRFNYVSPDVVDLAGDPDPNASIGKARWELSDVTLITGTWDQHRAVCEAHKPFRDLEYFRIGDDGRRHYVSVSGLPVFDENGRFCGYQGFGRNITDRKRIEQDLVARQEMLELAQKVAQAVAFELIVQPGLPSRWSPELEALHGLEPGGYDGTHEGWKRLVSSDDWPQVELAVQHAMASGDMACEYRVTHPDGSLHWLQMRGRVFFDAAGHPARMVGFALDVTERKQSEDERRVLERRLRQAQRLEAVGTLAGGIAHDFNNILGVVLGYGERALGETKAGATLARYLGQIMSAGERGRALVDRILAFSSDSVGESVAVHVEKVVAEALDLLVGKLPAGVRVEADLRADRAAIVGDPTQIHRVLMNLTTNAIQAMPAGGVLRVELSLLRVAERRLAMVGCLEPGAYVVLSVADEGTGMPAEVLERIFDPFFTTKETSSGTGLGLSLVHGIVTNMEGAIDVTTRQHEGSVFTVYLPRCGDVEVTASEEKPAVSRGAGQRVLLVDDEEALLVLAAETLEELGYKPLAFTSPTTALEAFRADPHHFDAVVTDERMPRMTGSALIEAVRTIRREIPIVLMSGFVGSGVANRAREAGADEVLKKPLSERDLAASLARVLRGSE